MALPANVGTCKVVGRFLRFVVDGGDADRLPEGVPIPGISVTFTPNLGAPIGRFLNGAFPTMFVIDAISATTDSSGILVGADGAEGVYLIASDDPDLTPNGWTYTAVVSAPSFPGLSLTFAAPVGGTVDLAAL